MKNESEFFLKLSAVSMVLAALFSISPAHADGDTVPSPKRSTDVQISTADIEPFSIDRKTDPDGGKPVFYSDGSTTVGFNEDGDPSVGTRF